MLSRFVLSRFVLSCFAFSRPVLLRTRALLRTLLRATAGMSLGALALVTLLGHQDPLVTGPALSATRPPKTSPPGVPASAIPLRSDGLSGPLSPDRRPPAPDPASTDVLGLRLLRVARQGTQLVVHALAQLPHPGRYYAYAELWGGPSGQTPLLFSRRQWEVPSAGEWDIGLLFTEAFTDPHRGRSMLDPSAENHLILRTLVIKSVDHHPSELVAKMTQVLLSGAPRIKSVPEGVPSLAQIPDGDRAAVLTRGIQVPAGSSERRQ